MTDIRWSDKRYALMVALGFFMMLTGAFTGASSWAIMGLGFWVMAGFSMVCDTIEAGRQPTVAKEEEKTPAEKFLDKKD